MRYLFLLLFLVACYDSPVSTTEDVVTDTIVVNDTTFIGTTDTVYQIDTVEAQGYTGVITYYNYNKLGDLTSKNVETLENGRRVEYITYDKNDVVLLHYKYIYNGDNVVEVHKLV